jgi:hypothetical protein
MQQFDRIFSQNADTILGNYSQLQHMLLLLFGKMM